MKSILKNDEILYSEKQSVRYEVNIVGSKVLETLDLRFLKFIKLTKNCNIVNKKSQDTAGKNLRSNRENLRYEQVLNTGQGHQTNECLLTNMHAAMLVAVV